MASYVDTGTGLSPVLGLTDIAQPAGVQTVAEFPVAAIPKLALLCSI